MRSVGIGRRIQNSHQCIRCAGPCAMKGAQPDPQDVIVFIDPHRSQFENLAAGVWKDLGLNLTHPEEPVIQRAYLGGEFWIGLGRRNPSQQVRERDGIGQVGRSCMIRIGTSAGGLRHPMQTYLDQQAAQVIEVFQALGGESREGIALVWREPHQTF